MARVLVVSAEPLGERMAGPAIRSLELARVLASENDVVLSAPGLLPGGAGESVETVDAGFEDYEALDAAVRSADVVVAQALPARLLSRLPGTGTRLIADLYNPTVFEVLEAGRAKSPASRKRQQRSVVRGAAAMLAAASRVMCASETQRDLWLGMLAALDRIPIADYDRDPSLRSFIDVVPFGIPATPPPAPASNPIREMFPAIGEDDIVLLWGGGVWNWMDAPTAVDAVLQINARRPQGPAAHLVFMGVDRPGPADLDAMRATGALLEHVRVADPGGELIHVNPGWVPYAERGEWLAGADVAIGAHHEHLETRFAFRTRLLDAIWAGLPTVTTEGDALSATIEKEGMGAVAPTSDPHALADAVERLIYDPAALAQARGEVARVAAGLSWEECAAPLLGWCRSPEGGLEPDARLLRRISLSRYPAIVAETAESEGLGGALARVTRNLRRLAGNR